MKPFPVACPRTRVQEWLSLARLGESKLLKLFSILSRSRIAGRESAPAGSEAMATMSNRLALCACIMLLAAPAAGADIDRVPHGARVRRLTVHPSAVVPPAAPLSVAVAPGIVVQTPFTLVVGDPDRVVRLPHELGPDGTYDDAAGLVRSIDGTPCGEACTRRALVRWGYAPAD